MPFESTLPSTLLSRTSHLFATSFPIRCAIALASSTLPARISLFLRLSDALIPGVTYVGSREVAVMVFTVDTGCSLVF